jgi:hypothetical protein
VVGFSFGPARSSVSEVANATAGVDHQLLGSAAMIFPAAAGATEPFPTRAIRLIVPFPAGGGTDIVGRVLGQRLYEGLGQPVVIDNRSGAGGTLGTGARRQVFARQLHAAASADQPRRQSEHLCKTVRRYRDGFRADHDGRFRRDLDGGASGRAHRHDARFHRACQGRPDKNV